MILFVLLSSLIAAHFRLGMGLKESISNRYGIFSVIVLSASIIALFDMMNEENQRKFTPVIITLCVSYHLLSGVFFFPEVPVRKQKLDKFISDLKNNKPFQALPPVIPSCADSIVVKSIENGNYSPK